MSPDPFQNLDPTQPVKVLPRYLSGPGAGDLYTAWPLPFDEDWLMHLPDDGTASAISPCLRLWTCFTPDPEVRAKGTWTIGANQVPFGQTTWQITFDATTPVELLHDVHAELLDIYRDDRSSDQDRLFCDSTAPQEAYAPLFARGWTHNVKTNGTQTFRPPDGLAGILHRYATKDTSGPAWRVWGGDPSEPLWQAHFSFGTPTTLVAAFTASLISTEPLQRTVQDIPVPTRRALYIATPTPGQSHGNTPGAAPAPPGARPGRTR
ncbi:DUF317 domain-containing protein [Streptomyces acidiscabies]|uniref:DUF317 domain-containing protein n=1 Tax=Streptomyces acidiscabies TaxID=42234 RepID=A0AAP6BJ97_9ACTN|nr:DUF317 domain-containing protein [Streptomyces acidiscabies]MBP5935394.1 DUF317 domain-containing protein [Streptomyces sp. LBUM 1476]MBZ3916757.1 DUF317 domain-containing protein [Streptomyces acidiscabies]MDX2965605.1 DUF317 domain-containing protein [Streptomyces acidiscabies]MDX3024893.1 DUF317 domain-containing protein [Streptomyces acidiscabies]MDX3795521.1 DUF317 domain-containing protein [Streptomyces acidiscabies]